MRVLTCSQMQRADYHTSNSGVFTGRQLMARAGACVVDLLLRDFIAAERFCVLVGPGNNGGDGYVVAQLLREKGLVARVYAFGEPKPGTDANWARSLCSVDAAPLCDFDPKPTDVVVDALFGAGGRPNLPQVVITALNRVASSGARLVAVDIPTGLDADIGNGNMPARAEATVTFHRKKPGHLSAYAAKMCGVLHVSDIGVRTAPDLADDIILHENLPQNWQASLPRPKPDDHKYTRGHVAIFSGEAETSGAASLAAHASQAAGAGAVTILYPDDKALSQHTSASIMRRVRGPGFSAMQEVIGLRGCNSVVIGPGYGGTTSDLREAVNALLKDEHHAGRLENVVLDADVFSAFATSPDDLFDAISRSTVENIVLTPHMGEFKRLFPDLDGVEVTMPKWRAAKTAADRCGATLVLKGYDTVIASATDRHVAINTNATPALAVAGSGDVLAGMIAGLLAQGMAARKAAEASVWLHAEAAKRAKGTITPDTLINAIPASWLTISKQSP